jgi:hypothetical protein
MRQVLALRALLLPTVAHSILLRRFLLRPQLLTRV